jgi:hypothetical protein
MMWAPYSSSWFRSSAKAFSSTLSMMLRRSVSSLAASSSRPRATRLAAKFRNEASVRPVMVVSSTLILSRTKSSPSPAIAVIWGDSTRAMCRPESIESFRSRDLPRTLCETQRPIEKVMMLIRLLPVRPMEGVAYKTLYLTHLIKFFYRCGLRKVATAMAATMPRMPRHRGRS